MKIITESYKCDYCNTEYEEQLLNLNSKFDFYHICKKCFDQLTNDLIIYVYSSPQSEKSFCVSLKDDVNYTLLFIKKYTYNEVKDIFNINALLLSKILHKNDSWWEDLNLETYNSIKCKKLFPKYKEIDTDGLDLFYIYDIKNNQLLKSDVNDMSHYIYKNFTIIQQEIKGTIIKIGVFDVELFEKITVEFFNDYIQTLNS